MENRQHEIEQEAANVTGRFSYRNGYGSVKDAFIDGAKWADAHPVNPWHKVFDETYPKGKYVFAKIKGRRPEIIHVSNLVHYHYWMEIPKNEEE